MDRMRLLIQSRYVGLLELQLSCCASGVIVVVIAVTVVTTLMGCWVAVDYAVGLLLVKVVVPLPVELKVWGVATAASLWCVDITRDYCSRAAVAIRDVAIIAVITAMLLVLYMFYPDHAHGISFSLVGDTNSTYHIFDAYCLRL